MATGEGDITTYCTANQSDDSHGVNNIRYKSLSNGFSYRRVRSNGYEDGKTNHDKACNLSKLIHGFAGFLNQENGDSHSCTNYSASFDINAEQYIKAQACATYVTNIEG